MWKERRKGGLLKKKKKVCFVKKITSTEHELEVRESFLFLTDQASKA